MVLLSSLENLPALSSDHRAAICPWMKKLARHRSEFAVAEAGAVLMVCGGEYPGVYRQAVARRHFEFDGVPGPLERACSQPGFADSQCSPNLRTLRRLALDRRSGAGVRTSAALAFAAYAPLPDVESFMRELGNTLPREEMEELKAEVDYRRRKKG
jgi:hypothetical protein